MTSARSSIGRLRFGFSVGSATVLRYQTIEALFEEKKLFDGTLEIDCSWVVAGRQGFGWGAVLHCFQGADVLRDELGSSGANFLTIQLTKEYTSSFTINWSECCLAPPQIPKIPVASGSGRAPGTRGQRWILFLKMPSSHFGWELSRRPPSLPMPSSRNTPRHLSAHSESAPKVVARLAADGLWQRESMPFGFYAFSVPGDSSATGRVP